MLSTLLWTLLGVATPPAETPDVSRGPAAAATPDQAMPVEGAQEPQRVGGDLFRTVEPNGPFFRSGAVLTDEHLPEGYPRPTPPDAIEIKQYPAVRRAQVTMKAPPGMGSNVAFWPLFRHISKRDIAMTTPVEMDMPSYQPGDAQGGAEALNQQDQWVMAFLYRTQELGDTGTDGVVLVKDQQPMTVLALGVQGDYWPRDLAKKLIELEAWLSNQSEWRAAGGARVMGYNGPNIPRARRWGEVQIPIVRAEPWREVEPTQPESAPQAAR